MKGRTLLHYSALLLPLFSFSQAQAADAAAAATTPPTGARTPSRTIEEMVVTAQKREENINNVGMSIQAATGTALKEQGISDSSDLYKIVTGFNSNVTYYGTTVYTIRGVGFQDTALASGPTVSIYIDEMPLPFSAMTNGLTLDLQRVEALKGPQGTLFGQNATGGAVNYIANKPSDHFESGLEGSFGRFNVRDIDGFVSGPITDTLGYRVAARALNGSAWQSSYTKHRGLAPDPYWTKAGKVYKFDNQAGDQEFYTARATLKWDPSDQLAALLTISGFKDKGDSQRGQLAGFAPLNPVNGLNPLVRNYPLAPHNDRAADWGPCVNISGGTPANLTGTANFDGSITGVTDPNCNAENLSNRLYDKCKPASKDNDFFSATLRADYDLTDNTKLTSLTSYGKFNRDQRLESDGTIYQDYESFQRGYLTADFQEFRVSGKVFGKGTWVVGTNYEYTSTWDSFIQTYGISTAVPTQVFTRTPLGPTNPNSRQKTHTYAVFSDVDYPVLDAVTLQAGVRYTNQKRDYRGCGSDAGDGSWSDISSEIQRLLQLLKEGVPFGQTVGLDAGPGKCASTGPGPTYFPKPSGFTDKLNQDNVSWRLGVNWQIDAGKLLYLTVSQGFKSGSFPTVASAAFNQLFPAQQEDLLSYEAGTKLRLLDDTLQFNAAAFYYHYTDKQVIAAVPDPIFGSLPALVNVPKSHVVGAEFSIEWYPVEGLRISPSMSYAKSKVDGTFRSFDPFFNGAVNGGTKDFSGEPFPNAPKTQANLDVQYEWNVYGEWTAFVGGNMNYQSETTGFFYDRCKEVGKPCTKRDYPGLSGDSDLKINERALFDLRAGIEGGPWRMTAFGRNITNKYYWNQNQHVNDVLVKFTGMPRTYGVTVAYRAGG